MKRARLTFAHVTGMLVGGLFLALTAHGLGGLAGRPRELLLASAVVAALASGSHLSTLLPWGTWQVPRDWSRLGQSGFALAYGAALGFGALTMLPSVALIAVLGGALVLDLPVALALGATFGVARAVPAAIAVAAGDRASGPVLTVIKRSVGRLAPLELVTLVALTAVLLLD